MTTPQQRFAAWLDAWLWPPAFSSLPRWHRALVLSARAVAAIARDLGQGDLTLRAMALAYTTLLSLVPLLAVSFSVLKGFGVHHQMEPWLREALAPLGEQGGAITAAKLLEFVDRTNVGVLGSVGLAFLLYSLITLIHKVETVFNQTWRAAATRSIGGRATRYLSVLMIAPVLFFSAIGATASVSSHLAVQQILAIEPIGQAVESAGRLLPFGLLGLTFAFIYAYVPNTRVRLRAAGAGALVAAVLWQMVGYVFATFMVGSTNYAAIYSGLAILILFMLWINIAWVIVLIGANIAFYTQYPDYLRVRDRDPRLSNRMRERLAVEIVGAVMHRYYRGESPGSAAALAATLGIPEANARGILTILEESHLLAMTNASPPGYLPARPPESISVKALIDRVRAFGEECGSDMGGGSAPGADIDRRIDAALEEALGGLSLSDLARASLPSAPEPAGPIDSRHPHAGARSST